MSASRKHNEEEFTEFINTSALDIKGNVIHINEAKSGRGGYYCRGCKREMQAVKTKKENRITYFRQDAEAVKGQQKCTYSDETERHKIAKDILQMIKKIKVPPLFKFPPNGVVGNAILLSEAKFIEAHTVLKERWFYENEEGEICWGKKEAIDETYLIVKPDVIFFDKENKPILFIEIVATNKISADKLAKIKRLGIDTIQVTIPTESPEEIENSFYTSKRTKWVYNDYEERTPYVRISNGDSKGISPVDEFQNKFFEESAICRKSRIKYLIRSINRCLESKRFREIDEAIRTEIYRVKGNTEGNRLRLDELQKGARIFIENEYRETTAKLENEERDVNTDEIRIAKEERNLEERYYTKKGEIEMEIGEQESIGGNAEEAIDNRRREIEEEARRIDQARRNFELDSVKETAEIRSIEREEDSLSGYYEQLTKGIERAIENTSSGTKDEIARIEKEQRELSERFELDRRELEKKYEDLRARLSGEVKIENVGGGTEFTREHKKLIADRALFKDFSNVCTENERIRKAYEIFNDPAFSM